MKKFSKVLSLLLAAVMVLSLAACGGSDSGNNSSDDGDNSTQYRVAMITDSGDITDQSFNQTTYEACKAFCEANDIDFTYYKPEDETDDARIAMVDAAVNDGFNVIVMPGYLFAAAIVETTDNYPDVKFVALDVSESDICAAAVGETYYTDTDAYTASDYYNTDNTYMAIYQEEIPGYMAGYAAVMLGYRHIGFLGGQAVPAVIRYGYGYVQGANAAAEDLGIADEVVVEYVYGGQFYGDSDITAAMDTWYQTNGVEVVFACGGGIYTSAAEAAASAGAKVIGVDVDQADQIDSKYGDGLTVTSAMKGLTATVNTLLDAIIISDTWSDYVGKIDTLGMVSTEDTQNYVGLATESTQWTDTYTVDNYYELVAAIYNGEVTISNDVTAMPEVSITVNEYDSIK